MNAYSHRGENIQVVWSDKYYRWLGSVLSNSGAAGTSAYVSASKTGSFLTAKYILAKQNGDQKSLCTYVELYPGVLNMKWKFPIEVS